MNEIFGSQNIDAHYTTNAKVVRSPRVAVSAPASIPVSHVFSDKDAKCKLKSINQDIYNDTQQSKKKNILSFLKVFGSIVLLIIGIRCAKKFFKKS
jgi:hypothetical protein